MLERNVLLKELFLMIILSCKCFVRQCLNRSVVPTLASWLLMSASSEVSEAFWLRAVERDASLLFSWPSKPPTLDRAAARSLSFFLTLQDKNNQNLSANVRASPSVIRAVFFWLCVQCAHTHATSAGGVSKRTTVTKAKHRDAPVFVWEADTGFWLLSYTAPMMCRKREYPSICFLYSLCRVAVKLVAIFSRYCVRDRLHAGHVTSPL